MDTLKVLLTSVDPSLSTTSAERQFMVPFPHNPNYVERKDVHSQLDELLTPKNDTQPRAALWALGGMGERLATSIFWVHANSEETFKACYQDIAKRIGIKGLEENQSTLQDAVKHWLESSESGEWIMVIDNLDNLDIESRYVPIRQGTILFTTRSSRILGDPRFAMPKNARIERNLNTGMTIQQYTELFKESVDSQANLLDKPLYRSLKEDYNSSASCTVMRTWAITIDKIKAETPSALEILQFMSVMDPEKISLKFPSGVRRQCEKHLTSGALTILDKPTLEGFVAIIDALDECDKDDNILLILYLLAQANELRTTRLKVFVTSRPETPFRKIFGDTMMKMHQLQILHNVP
ncbi:hypothetical protein EX30DRAFT_378703 [Ascodesmis nigricans]|uniref:Nephrocystin 3-like N-terminal domain-containing protein n=1 Tax=Ascodesmis nigricans TaxID=341454 RepID=A0A4V3SIN6_9PEZI|nr:hypothetical protein EX30DRAFT_378703 [Ascodesmis nigricans]